MYRLDDLEIKALEEIRNDNGYDFLANNYHLMSKEQLKRIAMECLYEISHNDNKVAMLNNIADEIEDYSFM